MANIDLSTKSVLLINKSDMENVCNILLKHRIKHYETIAELQCGKVVQTETYQSKMNFEKIEEIKVKKAKAVKVIKTKIKTPPIKIILPQDSERDNEHNKMLKFAKQMECKSISEAIQKVGSGGAFRKRFLKEYAH